jgi:hypothetical protein
MTVTIKVLEVIACVFLCEVTILLVYSCVMPQVQESSAAIRLKAIQQHLSTGSKPAASTIQNEKYSPKPQPYEPFRPVKVSDHMI